MWTEEKLKTITAEHLQAFLDLLTFGGEFPDGKEGSSERCTGNVRTL